MNEENFQWEISGENLTGELFRRNGLLVSICYLVSALGIKVDGIALTSKVVTLKGFNGLKGGVVIQSFDLPENDPDGGIHLTIQATTDNVSAFRVGSISIVEGNPHSPLKLVSS